MQSQKYHGYKFSSYKVDNGLFLPVTFHFQAERLRKEEADAHRKAEDEAKKKIALSNMGSGYSSILQRVNFPLFCFAAVCEFVATQKCNYDVGDTL